MKGLRKRFAALGLATAVLHGLVLAGCGGSSPAGPAGSAQVNLRVAGMAAARFVAARGAAVAGATIQVDGVDAGVTDADGEITLALEPGTHAITVSVDGMDPQSFDVTVGEGAILEIEVELEDDGTLVIEQDLDHDGDVDEDDLDDDEDDDEDEDEEDDDEDGTDD